MPVKKTKTKKAAAKKTVAKKPTKVRKAVRKAPVKKRSKWALIAVGLFAVLILHLLFTYNFTVKRTTLRMFEYLGIANQTHDLEGHRIFEVNGITYVAYDHPLVTAKIVTDIGCDNEMCDVDILKREILTNLTPAIQFEEVALGSPEGKRLTAEVNAKSIPAFVFDDNIKLLGNFEFIEDFFIEYENYYLLKTPPGKFIATPHNEDTHTRGAVNPKIVITEFSSFSCEFCKGATENLKSVLASYPDEIALHYIHFNRGGHDNSLIRSAECAAEQGAFWEMHNAIFDRQADFVDKDNVFRFDLVAELANALDLEPKKFAECMKEEGRFASKLQAMQRLVADFSIKASPSMFINEEFVEGVLTEQQLRSIIEELLHEANDTPSRQE